MAVKLVHSDNRAGDGLDDSRGGAHLDGRSMPNSMKMGMVASVGLSGSTESKGARERKDRELHREEVVR
jgi:hypothetical protein